MRTLPITDVKNVSKECRITFIIGNGFDLGLNMKTRYSNVYEGYIKASSASENIARFKKCLTEDASRNYENWSDFEMGMADYAKELSSENELVECIRDFKRHMVEHLREENERIIELIKDTAYSNGLLKELDRSLDYFYTGLTPNAINRMTSLADEAEVIRKYITFNYTSTLEAFLALKGKYQKILESAPLHIHGSLDSDVVLGVDNEDQVKAVSFAFTNKGRRAFIKTLFNEQFDAARVNQAKETIAQSDIICVYGFSMGKSDKTWNDALASWLLADEKHHLVVYQYEQDVYNQYNFDEIMDVEDEKKEQLLLSLGITDKEVLNQVHIPIGADIFNFSFVKIESTYRPAGTMKNYYP